MVHRQSSEPKTTENNRRSQRHKTISSFVFNHDEHNHFTNPKIWRDSVKKRAEARRELPNSSDEECSDLSSGKVDTNSWNRKSRTARTERFLQRRTKLYKTDSEYDPKIASPILKDFDYRDNRSNTLPHKKYGRIKHKSTRSVSCERNKTNLEPNFGHKRTTNHEFNWNVSPLVHKPPLNDKTDKNDCTVKFIKESKEQPKEPLYQNIQETKDCKEKDTYLDDTLAELEAIYNSFNFDIEPNNKKQPQSTLGNLSDSGYCNETVHKTKSPIRRPNYTKPILDNYPAEDNRMADLNDLERSMKIARQVLRDKNKAINLRQRSISDTETDLKALRRRTFHCNLPKKSPKPRAENLYENGFMDKLAKETIDVIKSLDEQVQMLNMSFPDEKVDSVYSEHRKLCEKLLNCVENSSKNADATKSSAKALKSIDN